jgi:transposase InsO family protein
MSKYMAYLRSLLQQADHSPAGTYGYLDTERIRADAGSQFTSGAFASYCTKDGINLVLAAPKKQYQNHLAEHTGRR